MLVIEMSRLGKTLLIVSGVVVVAVVTLALCFNVLLWRPSLKGKCGGQALGEPAPPLPHITRFRGKVVGRSLWLVQYRWLRRRFAATGTTLSLVRELPSTVYEGNVVRHGERAGDTVIGDSGHFDFGDLPPGQYDVTVSYPGEDAVGFGFVIDPSARGNEVLIDASPAYYCNCCGWNFELH